VSHSGRPNERFHGLDMLVDAVALNDPRKVKLLTHGPVQAFERHTVLLTGLLELIIPFLEFLAGAVPVEEDDNYHVSRTQPLKLYAFR